MQDDFSIERLLEFGVGMAIARQMTEKVNRSLMSIEHSQDTHTQDKHNQVYVVVNGEQAGPFNEEELKQLFVQKTIGTETLAWFQGLSQWKRLVDIPELYRILLLNKIK